jgi:hypothetical protein
MLKLAKLMLYVVSLSLALGAGVEGWAACISKQDGACNCRYNLDLANQGAINPPAIVDFNEANGNLLVRGPLPLIIRNGPGNDNAKSPCNDASDWTFAYDNLDAWIKQLPNPSPAYFDAAKSDKLKQALSNFNLRDYNLIDISLIDNQYNAPTLAAEMRALGVKPEDVYSPDGCWPPGNCSHFLPRTLYGKNFAQVTGHPSGQFVWWPVWFWGCQGDNAPSPKVDFFCSTDGGADMGCPATPWPEGSICDPLKLLQSPGFNFIDLVDFLGELLRETEPSGKKRLIYFHCILGSDRTGGLHMAYLLNNYVTSFAKAREYAKFPIGLHYPNTASQRLVNAYCHYLQALHPDKDYDCTVPAQLLYDFDRDGDQDLRDFIKWLTKSYLPGAAGGDLNGDGRVDIDDVKLMWEKTRKRRQ